MHSSSAVADNLSWSQALRSVHVEAVLLPVLMQLAIVIVAARVFANLFRRLGQPMVVGEIAAGLILGPSLFGRLFPRLFETVFRPEVPGLPSELSHALIGWILTSLSQIGLILLLFLIGHEFDFRHLKWQGRKALAISLSGMILPFGLGMLTAWWMHPYVGNSIPVLGFALFLATTLCITAIPILGRIMIELNMTRTRLGTITIASAAVDDAAGWILLATVAAVVQAQFAVSRVLWMIGATVAFGCLMVFVARPLLLRWVNASLRSGQGTLSLNSLALLLALIFCCAITTNLIGIFAIFGAFLLGSVLSDQPEFRTSVADRLRDFVSAFFLPIFFAYTGLRTDVGSLESWYLWAWCGLVCLAAIGGKLGGCALAARWTGSSWNEALCIGALMNTRALMALVVINLGKDMGVVPEPVFCMLVLMALLTTVMTTPMLLYFMRGTELEPYIRASDFLRARQRRDAPSSIDVG